MSDVLLATLAQNTAFNTALIESGFSPAEVTRILSALNEAGLAVVAMESRSFLYDPWLTHE